MWVEKGNDECNFRYSSRVAFLLLVCDNNSGLNRWVQSRNLAAGNHSNYPVQNDRTAN